MDDYKQQISVWEIFKLVKEMNYVKEYIWPLLHPDNREYFYEWMKSFGLIRNIAYCTNVKCPLRRRGQRVPMIWRKYRNQDGYIWWCPVCLAKVSIRCGSFFAGFYADFSTIFQILYQWCVQLSRSESCQTLGVQDSLVISLYNSFAHIANNIVNKQCEDFKLGGSNAFVLIDIFPDGWMDSTPPPGCVPRNKVLCILEVTDHHPRIWLKILGKDYVHFDTVVNEVCKHVEKDSIIVAADHAQCPAQELRKNDFNVHTVEELSHVYIPRTRTLPDTLKILWQDVVELIYAVENLKKSMIPEYINENIWRYQYSHSDVPLMHSILCAIADDHKERWQRKRLHVN